MLVKNGLSVARRPSAMSTDLYRSRPETAAGNAQASDDTEAQRSAFSESRFEPDYDTILEESEADKSVSENVLFRLAYVQTEVAESTEDEEPIAPVRVFGFDEVPNKPVRTSIADLVPVQSATPKPIKGKALKLQGLWGDQSRPFDAMCEAHK